jgi:hypothetical protein
MLPRRLLTLLLLLAAPLVLAAAESAAPVNFNREILPILSDACFHCHGPDAATREAKLRLDDRDGLFRTRDGVTVVKPGDLKASELFQRITSAHEDEVMPPPKATRKLKPAEVDLLRRWIESGAPWGGHWAYEAPRRAEPPSGFGAHPIDAFVRARLAREKLIPAPEAAPAALLRRVSLDLTGLPPTEEELVEFLSDRTPVAYERAVDRLLASPRYGERWAWDWLDAARYADTNGFQGDPERTMWPWRDWVVNALNANMPFDRFSIEQLAGDLLPDATRDQKIASGFHRNNMFNGEGGRIAEETRVENVFDRVETTGAIWLGMTLACSRCHDHKYDPVSQRDYYALYDIFNQMSETGRNSGGQVPPILDISTPEELAEVKRANAAFEATAKRVEEFELRKFPRPEGKPLVESDAAKLPGNLPNYIARTEPKRRGVDALLEAVSYFEEHDKPYAALLSELLEGARERTAAQGRITKVMIMDQIPEPRETAILTRGNYEAKTEVKAYGAVPALFRRGGAEPGPNNRINRLDLARWLVSPGNPLAARVTVNRAWQALFGTGFVKTAEDFGVQGEPPSHPELIDWLAAEFVASGWDMKRLHRLIVTSATYRQSSRVGAELRERDPDNRLLARGPRHRMPSWMIRDQALAVAGLVNLQMGGPSVRPYQPAGIWEEATFGKKNYVQDHGDALYRRSLYVFWRRIVGPTTFFDSGARQVCTLKVPITNTPLHALVTLNDPAYVEAARVMAQRVLSGAGDDSVRLARAFRLATARPPTAAESGILSGRLSAVRAQFASDRGAAEKLAAAGEARRASGLDPVEHAAWTALCSLLLNLDEVLSKE